LALERETTPRKGRNTLRTGVPEQGTREPQRHHGSNKRGEKEQGADTQYTKPLGRGPRDKRENTRAQPERDRHHTVGVGNFHHGNIATRIRGRENHGG